MYPPKWNSSIVLVLQMTQHVEMIIDSDYAKKIFDEVTAPDYDS